MFQLFISKKLPSSALGWSLALIILGIGFTWGQDSQIDKTGQPWWLADPTGVAITLESDQPASVKENKAVDFKLFWRVWNDIQSRFIEPSVPDEKLFYGAVSGLVSALGDPYSSFLDPALTKEFSEELDGAFEGIGMEIGIKQDRLTVITPLPGSPAEKVGLRAGDKILAIDGQGTTGLILEQAVKMIRGPSATKVTLLILHPNEQAAKEITVTRARIEVKSVTWKMDQHNPKIAVITLAHFNDQTLPALRTALPQILAKNPKGLVLDLRNNPGGYLETAAEVAGLWVKEGAIVTQRGRSEKEFKEHQANGNAKLVGIPTVVLVNMGTASAAEIVAGALQDYGVAQLVGEKTFGKGSVQEYERMPDGSSLKLTVAKWFTPKGRSIHEQGISPDIEVKLTPEDYNQGKDPQYEQAVKLLK